jgi:hypothetical protein
MSQNIHLQSDVSIRRGQVRRRDFLKCIPAAALAAGALARQDAMIASAADLRRQGKACILLWMQGGPSQFETFSPLPGHANGGETKAINTAVSGIEISENLPETAKAMGELCLIRSMTSKEGSHPRATYLMHTGTADGDGQVSDAGRSSPKIMTWRELPACGSAERFSTAGTCRFDPFLVQDAGHRREHGNHHRTAV